MSRSKAEILEELAAVSEELRRTEDLAKLRDRLVVEATRAEASRSEVGKAAGVSRGRVQQIVTEDRKTKIKRTQTGLATILLLAGIGAALTLGGGDAPPTQPDEFAAKETTLSVSDVRASDVDLQVKWLATVALRRDGRSSFDARTLKFSCNGISSTDAKAVESLLKTPITNESLVAIDDACPDRP